MSNIIYTSSSGMTTIDSSEISIIGGQTSYGIYSDSTSANTTILTGKIKLTDATTSYGAYIDTGSFTMGYNENEVTETVEVSQENPYLYVQGTSRGIGIKKVNGSFNFYDGIIWASKYAKPEITTNVQHNYEVTTYVEEDTEFEYALLEYMGDDYDGTAVAILNGVYYKTVQEAINKAEYEETGEIKLLRPVTEDLIVDNGKTVTINLNNYSITTNFVNNGTLTIYNGVLQNVEETTVINNGTFIMGIDDGRVSSTSVRVISENTAVENNGTFIMYDGYIEGNPSISGEINKIADFARIRTVTDDQSEKKYLQSLSRESIENGETDLILTIDPNSGIYDGSSNKLEIYLKYEEEYELKEPTKRACIFKGWESSDPDVLTNNTIKMSLSDVIVKAKWEVSPDAVAKNGNEYYLSLADALENSKEGDTIELLKDTAEDITNTAV